MAEFTDALRGYAFPIHERDNFTCRYCGLDGTVSFANWLSLDLLQNKGPDGPKALCRRIVSHRETNREEMAF